ncbi:MAG: class I mannose-6-phosphate isomerase [Lachnospiraceae bacterium]|nr:class I mannose-6-phosphate isomerase [Lachnospiraceae bacterium]
MSEQKAQLNAPFLLDPAGKDYIWGGRRLKDDFSKNLDLTPLAETWECSTHPDGPARAASGPFKGELLQDILREHQEFFGTHPSANPDIQTQNGELPVLIKFIDAKRDLSVQVHPDDDYARTHENGALGKSEMWYVVDATPTAHLIYGFNRDMDRESVLRALDDGSIEKYLQKVPVQKGDVFYIQSGTVHAICAGALVVEVQESSNLTYRLYDYHRKGKDGKERPLHIAKALDVANLKGSAQPRQPMHVLRYHPGIASEFLCRCKYFEVEHILLNTERIRPMASYKSSATSFEVLIVTDGCGMLMWNSESLPFFRGDTFFVPADSPEIHIHGKAELLRVTC